MAPTVAGELADAFPPGLAIPLWMPAGGSVLVFLVALFMTETAPEATEAHPARA